MDHILIFISFTHQALRPKVSKHLELYDQTHDIISVLTIFISTAYKGICLRTRPPKLLIQDHLKDLGYMTEVKANPLEPYQTIAQCRIFSKASLHIVLQQGSMRLIQDIPLLITRLFVTLVSPSVAFQAPSRPYPQPIFPTKFSHERRVSRETRSIEVEKYPLYLHIKSGLCVYSNL